MARSEMLNRVARVQRAVAGLSNEQAKRLLYFVVDQLLDGERDAEVSGADRKPEEEPKA